jgi:phage shock protein PspC (stress-responsive transcriptional regulator)
MNKTVTINISGIIFHIEEDAFDSLSKYLSTIKGYFSKTDGGNEIMSDIEARIAELLQTKINVSKQVILMTDVDYVMNVMGKPEEFGEEQSKDKEENFARTEETTAAFEKVKRKLFRNPDEKAIGGVCSGLAAYFDIDTVWVRLAMFLLVFFGGVSLWVYIILWIVIPEAKTTADKLAMRGESANVNTIFQSFKEEANDVKSRMSKYGKDFKNQNYGEAVRSNAASVLSAFFNVIGRLIGLFLIIIGGVLLFAYLTSILGISIVNSNNDITHWRDVIFESTGDYTLGLLAFIIVIGIPVVLMVFGGVKLLFRIRYNNRWLNIGLAITWVIGIIVGFYVTFSTVKQFNQSTRLKETNRIHNVGDTLVVKMNPAALQLKEMNFDNTDDLETYFTKNHSGFTFGEQNKNLSILGFAGLSVSESTGDSVEVVISQTARGYDKKDANENAKAITYTYKQDKNTLIFDEIFSVMEGSKFRTQEVDVKIKLPLGMVIYFDKSVKYLLDDVDNITNTWDGDMISRRWIMTSRGLKCIDCDNLDNNDRDEDGEITISKNKKITINGEGVNIDGEDTQIKIDENGIKIRTPEKEIELNNNDRSKSEKELRRKEREREDDLQQRERDLQKKQEKMERELKRKEEELNKN